MKTIILAVLLALAQAANAGSGFNYVFPSITHADGKNGALWRSSVSISNAGEVAVEVDARNYLAWGQINPKWTLKPNETLYFDDVVADLGLPDGTYALQFTVLGPDQTFEAAGKVSLIAKTYNLLPDGKRLWTVIPPKTWGAASYVVPFDKSPGMRNRLYILVWGTNWRIRLFGPDGVFYDQIADTSGLISFPVPDWASSAIVEKVFTAGPGVGVAGADLYAYSTSTDNASGDTTVIP